MELLAQLASAGWESGYKPPAEYFNYKWNNDYNCINELQNVLKTRARTTKATHTASQKHKWGLAM